MLVEEAIPTNTTSSRARLQNFFSLLPNCNTLKILTQIHTQIITNGFTQKNFVLVKLLSLYISFGYLPNATQIFERIENPSTTVWNQIIRGHGRSQRPHKSVDLYNVMCATEAKPDGYTYSYVISACARGRLLTEGKQVHVRVLLNGFDLNPFVRTSLINLYAMGGEDDLCDAHHLFDETLERNTVSWNSLLAGYLRCRDINGAERIFYGIPNRNIISWTTMIAGCARNGRCEQALSLFREMQRANIEFDHVALVAALSASAEVGDLKLGRWIHSYMNDTLCGKYQQVPVTLNNALVHMYASCGVIDEAYKVFKEMPRRSTVSWTSMIVGFAKQGRGEEALGVFRWMMLSCEANEAKPDWVTFVGVLCACSHAGFVNEGRHFFKSMVQNWGIEPRIEHYGCMVDLLSRAGFLNEAHGIVKTMPMNPNDAVWGALLGGCRIHKNVELASVVSRKLAQELDPNRASGYLVLLSNIYATAKRWQDVVAVRRKMIEMGVKKPPGRSWIQIDGVIHEFLSGNGNNKHTSSTCEMVSAIAEQAKSEDYKPEVLELLLYST